MPPKTKKSLKNKKLIKSPKSPKSQKTPKSPKSPKSQNLKINLKILEELCNIASPSGFENDLLKYIINQVENNKHFNYIKTNKKSLLVYNKNLDLQKETILIDGHIDQIYMKIIGFLDTNHVLAIPIGFDGSITDGLKLVHLKSKKTGIVDTNPPHLNIERRETNEIYIDFDMTKDELEEIMTIGDYIVYKHNFELIGNNSVSGTGLDNKVSVCILLELLNRFKIESEYNKLCYNIIFNFSSREEIGMGSIGSILNNNFIKNLVINEIITLDTIFTNDNAIQDDIDKYTSLIYYGLGPVITRNSDDDVCFGDSFILLADKNKIKIQIAFTGEDNGGSNNADYSKFTDAYTQFIGVPLKNMHSPSELVNISDINDTYKLLYKYLIWGDDIKKCSL